jgi:hypothetical protein
MRRRPRYWRVTGNQAVARGRHVHKGQVLGTMRNTQWPQDSLLFPPITPSSERGSTMKRTRTRRLPFQRKITNFVFSGFCRSDGEEFDIRQVKWDGRALSFMARMPSTDNVTKNVFRMRPDGKLDLDLNSRRTASGRKRMSSRARSPRLGGVSRVGRRRTPKFGARPHLARGEFREEITGTVAKQGSLSSGSWRTRADLEVCPTEQAQSCKNSDLL